MAKSSPTARALADCKKRGWRAAVTEKWIAQTMQRKDLFGFGDLIALDGQTGSLLLQVTSTTNAPSRVTKICTECSAAARDWLRAGNRIEVWGYAKRGAEGKRKLWALKVYPITADMLAAQEEHVPKA